jgi:MoxR-like ATPase
MMNLDNAPVAQWSQRVLTEVERAIIGKTELLTEMIAAVLVPGGHLLLEDYPGLAKTLIARSFATVLGLAFKRIQFTPDLLPGDITGGYVYDRNESRFTLREGPLFANVILADEINRASPKTQSALLEAMQEYQVTLEGETLPLPQPFLVIATQNPIEYEGTFPLPEAQLDRFVMKLAIGYPSASDEEEILRRRQRRGQDEAQLTAVTNAAELQQMRQLVEKIYLDPDLERYIVALIRASRSHNQVAVGASPRASLALMKLSRAWAALHGRDYVLPDDVKKFVRQTLIHRLILDPELWMRKRATDEIISHILQTVPVPVASVRREE